MINTYKVERKLIDRVPTPVQLVELRYLKWDIRVKNNRKSST